MHDLLGCHMFGQPSNRSAAKAFLAVWGEGPHLAKERERQVRGASVLQRGAERHSGWEMPCVDYDFRYGNQSFIVSQTLELR